MKYDGFVKFSFIFNLYIHLSLDTHGKFYLTPYEKRVDFNVSIVYFPFFYSNIVACFSCFLVYSQSYAMKELVTNTLYNEAWWLQISYSHRVNASLGYQCPQLFMVVITILLIRMTPLYSKLCWIYLTSLNSMFFFNVNFDYTVVASDVLTLPEHQALDPL